jgi:hypothetical protein
MENEYLYSWLRIHKSRPVRKVFPQSISELQSLLAELKSNQQPYNFVGSYAIDLYFNKDDLALAESAQRQIADNFSIRPHWGKSILRPYVLDHLDRGLIEIIRLLRSEYSEGSLLRPNLGDISFDFGQNSEPDATISRVDGD